VKEKVIALLCSAYAVPAVVGVLAIAPLIWLLDHQPPGSTFVGTDGPYADDQGQYLSWVRDGAHHLLASDLFVTRPTGHVFIEPLFLGSTLLVRLGLPIQWTFLAFLPLAFAFVVYGFDRYASRWFGKGLTRQAVLLLAFFAFPPVAWFLDMTGHSHGALYSAVFLSLGLEQSTVASLWGYLPTAIAIGCLPLCLLTAERAVHADQESIRRGALALAALYGLLVSWLHPWQGFELAVALAVASIPYVREIKKLVWIGSVEVVVVVPLIYYTALAKFDWAWKLASNVNAAVARPHVSWLAIGAAPLILLALPGLRIHRLSFADRALLGWLVGVAIGYFALRSWPFHVFDGSALPLAVLAGLGWQRTATRARMDRRWVVNIGAIGLLALFTVPGIYLIAENFHSQYVSPNQTYFLNADQAAAMRFLANDPTPGAVLAPNSLDNLVPEFTGRSTYSGHWSWTPDFNERSAELAAFYGGDVSKEAARTFVHNTRARFVLVDGCGSPVPAILDYETVGHTECGCVGVLELRQS
jgi:hypothetical protein